MPLYQLDNSTAAQHARVDLYDDFFFIPHLHKDFELAYVLEGEVEVCLRERRETARAGELALVFPNEIHAYATPYRSRVPRSSERKYPAFAEFMMAGPWSVTASA